jgi:metallo-beta-lactamase family protein
MKLTFHGGAKSVTGSNYLLESGGHSILIDCGLHQGRHFCELGNWDQFPYKPKQIQDVFITHAHIDHTGRLPKLYRDGFRGTIYSTSATRDASEFLLADSDHILSQEARRCKKNVLFHHSDVQDVMRLWKGVPYHQTIESGPFKVTFYNAGHILGSSFIVVEAEGKRVVFSGDLGNTPSPLIGPTEAVTHADYCLIESTYGGRFHDDFPRRKEILEDLIEDTVKSKGVLLIPAFAMERTQELLYEIDQLAENGRIPRLSIFIDSPLAIRLIEVYKKHESYFNPTVKHFIKEGGHFFNFPGLSLTLDVAASKAINHVPKPKVIIAGSGMSHGGRILHHEKHYLPDPTTTLLIVGYQGYGSLGRKLLDGDEVVKIHGQSVHVRARIRAISGYSAHADQRQLLEWLEPMRFSLRKLFVVQGEEESSRIFAQTVRDKLAIDASVPSASETHVL